MCSSSVRLVLFACVFGFLTILLTLTIISGLYLFVLSWSQFCQTVPSGCEDCDSITTNCDYLVAATTILSGQSALIIICFYSIICFYVSLKRNIDTNGILDREQTPELATPFFMSSPGRGTVNTSGTLPPYSEAPSDTECLIRPRQPPTYEDISQ